MYMIEDVGGQAVDAHGRASAAYASGAKSAYR